MKFDFDTHYPTIKRKAVLFAGRYRASLDDIHEVTQEVAYRMLKAMPDMDTPEAYIAVGVMRAYNMLYRGRIRRQEVELTEARLKNRGVAPKYNFQLDCEKKVREIAQLCSPTTKTIIRHLLQDATYKEIETKTGLTESNIKKRMMQLKQRVRAGAA